VTIAVRSLGSDFAAERASGGFETDTQWLPFHSNPTKPSFKLPASAVDAHCHVFGPGALFPYSADRKYTPCDAPKEKLWAIRDFLGFERNVIVQATCHGADNSALLDALRSSMGRARGIATVRKSVTDDELSALHAAGVRGVRFNFVKRLGETPSQIVLANIAKRVKSLGWHVVIYFEAIDLPELYDFIAALPTMVVIDHMGRPDVTQPLTSHNFELFVRLMAECPHVWSKVTCPERLSHSGPPQYSDVIPFARLLVEKFPNRVLWGTDWPHPNLKTHMPDDGNLVDFIPHIAVTPELQRRMLVDNPLQLYWNE
jgi:2-pyrone-4,6-dicarboxylate lactonase